MLRRILVANRGEIALRVIRAARELGVESVAVFSEADRGAPYLELADDTVCIGPAASAQSYLDIPRIISAAEITDADAIHPGYGFLAENAHFAEVCRSCGITFIGPPPEVIDSCGDKITAKATALGAGVPVVPGSDGPVEDPEEAVLLAKQIGFPVIIKATAGGGGRGMRVAGNENGFPERLQPGAAGGRGRLRQPDGVRREVRREPAPCRDPGARRRRRRGRPPRRARLLHPASPPEADRGGAVAGARPGTARAHGQGRRRLRPRGRLPQRRHRRVPARQARRLLLHRTERAHPGRALRDRGGHRHRPGAVAAAHRGGGEPRLHPGRRRPERPRDRVPHQRRGPGAQLRADPRQGRAAVLAGRAQTCASTAMCRPATRSRATTTR